MSGQIHKTCLTVGLGLLCSAPAAAQTERTSTAWREECQNATAALRAGPTHPGYEYARSVISRCDVTGGPAMADRWAQISGEDRHDLQQLRGQTIRDRVLLNRILSLVQDPTRPSAVRVMLIDILISYYAPGRRLSSAATDPNVDPGLCGLASVTHWGMTESTDPILPEDRPRILEVIGALARTSATDPIGRVAACAWHPLMRLAEREGRGG